MVVEQMRRERFNEPFLSITGERGVEEVEWQEIEGTICSESSSRIFAHIWKLQKEQLDSQHQSTSFLSSSSPCCSHPKLIYLEFPSLRPASFQPRRSPE